MTTLKLAIKKMLDENEFEKVIKIARGRDKENAKQFYDAIKDFTEEDFEKVPDIVFIQACKSWNIWQDLIIFVELIHDEEHDTEEA